MDTGVVFYRNQVHVRSIHHPILIHGIENNLTPVLIIFSWQAIKEEEDAARSFQGLIRAKKNCPVLSFWESFSYTFVMPPEVEEYLRERGGWGVIRRRGFYRRRVEDEGGLFWSEAQDPVSGEFFFTEQDPTRGW